MAGTYSAGTGAGIGPVIDEETWARATGPAGLQRMALRAALLVVVGALLIAAAAQLRWDRAHDGWVDVTATVVPDAPGPNQERLEFTLDGRTHRVVVSVPKRTSGTPAATTRRLRVDPNHPERAELGGVTMSVVLRLFPLTYVLGGIAMAIQGGVQGRSARRRRDEILAAPEVPVTLLCWNATPSGNTRSRFNQPTYGLAAVMPAVEPGVDPRQQTWLAPMAVVALPLWPDELDGVVLRGTARGTLQPEQWCALGVGGVPVVSGGRALTPAKAARSTRPDIATCRWVDLDPSAGQPRADGNGTGPDPAPGTTASDSGMPTWAPAARRVASVMQVILAAIGPLAVAVVSQALPIPSPFGGGPAPDVTFFVAVFGCIAFGVVATIVGQLAKAAGRRPRSTVIPEWTPGVLVVPTPTELTRRVERGVAVAPQGTVSPFTMQMPGSEMDAGRMFLAQGAAATVIGAVALLLALV